MGLRDGISFDPYVRVDFITSSYRFPAVRLSSASSIPPLFFAFYLMVVTPTVRYGADHSYLAAVLRLKDLFIHLRRSFSIPDLSLPPCKDHSATEIEPAWV